MRRIILLALNDLRLTVSERSTLIWMLLMPIAFMWFFGQMNADDQPGPPRVALDVEDRDGGWLARAFVDDLAADHVSLTEVGPSGGDDATPRARTLVIPDRFSDGALAGEQQILRLEKHPGADQDFSLTAEVHIIRTIVRALARLVELRPTTDREARAGGAVAEEEFRRLGERSPLVSLEVSTAGAGRPVPRGMAQSVPGMLTMMVLMMTVIYGGVFLTAEKRDRMLLRQVALPVSRSQIFLGKLLGRLLVAGMQIVVLVLAGRTLFGLDYGRSTAGLLLLLVSYAVAVAALSTMLGALLSTPEQASSIGWMLSMVLAAMGGCWWPSEVMPDWLWSAAHVLPTAWAMEGFHALISFGHGLEAVLLPSAALLGFGLIFSAVGARFLKPV